MRALTIRPRARPWLRRPLLVPIIGAGVGHARTLTSSPPPPPAPSSSAVPTDTGPPNTALLLFCLSTGLVDSLTFAVSGVWCAFVTGTTVQLGMDLPGLFFHSPDYFSSAASIGPALSHFVASDSSQRLAALSGFLFGGLGASRFPSFITPAKSTLAQSALLASASALVLGHAGAATLPYPHVTLALISSSMAVQAVLVQRFATPYATSVAWTSVWLGAVSPGPSSRRWKKVIGISTVMAGAAVGAGIMQLGKDDDAEDSPEGSEDGRDELVRRVGLGLAAAAALKTVVAGIFWRRARIGRL